MSAPAKVPVSFNIITKDQPEPTINAVKSIFDQVFREGDEIVVLDTGSSDENLATLRGAFDGIDAVKIYAEKLSEPLAPYVEKWLGESARELIGGDGQYEDLCGTMNFAALRQRAADLSEHDVICWIDSDDVIEDDSCGGLRDIVDKFIGGGQGASVFMDYLYAFAEDGTCTTTLKRERFIDKRYYQWVGRCHETLIPKEGMPQKDIGYWENLPARIRHTEARKTGNVSDIRNYIILRRELEELPEGAQPDPRTVFYLGNAARGLLKYDEALNLYKMFDTISGSVDDRFAASQYIAGIYMTEGYQRPFESGDWFDKCIELKPEDPRGYFGKSRTYFGLARWNECVHWYEIGRRLPFPAQTVHSVDPTHINYHPHIVAAGAYKELGNAEAALECVQRAKNARPDLKDADELLKTIRNLYAGTKLTDAVGIILQNCKDLPNAKVVGREIVDRLNAVPKELEERGLSPTEGPDPREPAPDIAIICGETLEPWGPRSGESGIGGSEKMVLLLAPRLQAAGYNVTVYNTCPFVDRGVDKNGVRWEHWASIDPKKPRKAAIYWRNKGLVKTHPVAAEKRFFWLHDVQRPSDYSPELLEAVDAIQFQSKYHTKFDMPVDPGDKYWIARNAITPEVFDASKSDPNKVIYCSSPDRGLFTALSIFALAKEVKPELEMDICYGFSPFYRKITARGTHCHIPDLARDASRDDYERMINAMIDKTGARMHHRVSFEKCAAMQNEAGIWLYPTRFPEISCMAAMETQAAGCIPVATTYGALAETLLDQESTLPHAPVPMNDEWLAQAAKQVLDASNIAADDPRRQALSDAAKKAYCADALAKEWIEWIER